MGHEHEHSHGVLCGLSSLSCRRYSELASRRLDGPLSFSENALYWFHHMLCITCRRYNRQISMIEKALGRAHQEPLDQTIEQAAPLSDDGKERIRAALKDAP